MGTYSDFRIGNFQLESSGNFHTTRHHSIFRQSDRAIVEREYAGEKSEVEVFQAPLGSLVTRLELLGSTLDAIKTRFENPFVTYDEPHDIPFSTTLKLVRNADVGAIRDWDTDRDGDAVLPSKYHPKLTGLESQNLMLVPGWDLSSLLDRLDTYDTLRILAERPENLDLMVVWDFMDVVHSGYFKREEFTVGSDGQFLLVTEGTSDTDIIRHAFNILRPEIADFFRYVDMEKNYPFGGHGNLVNFMKGLHSIGKSSGVLAIFDNDTAGIGSLKELSRIPEVKAVKLPDIKEFKKFPTIGPNGEHLADINGRAAAIECYLDLPPGCRIRWNNYDPRMGDYHGAIDQKNAEKSRQRDAFLKTKAGDNYPFQRIERVLDMIVRACTT